MPLQYAGLSHIWLKISAQELHHGNCVSLGIGLPTKVQYVPEGMEH